MKGEQRYRFLLENRWDARLEKRNHPPQERHAGVGTGLLIDDRSSA
jgi:hypothetical protein